MKNDKKRLSTKNDKTIFLPTREECGVMWFDVQKIYPDCHFEISGVSYAGKPKNNTAMYITKKVEYLVENLRGHKNCLCFIQKGTTIPEKIMNDNVFVFSENPAYDYALLAEKIAKRKRERERKVGYTLTDDGYYIGKNVRIGENVEIEPNVLIGHDVVIGDNARIMSGSIIKHAIIGHDFICNENAVIGNFSYTLTEDNDGNRFRIPALGRVIIGNHVEVGLCNDIAVGACGDTILEDYVKLAGLVSVGHEAYLHKNVEISAGTIVAGFVEICEQVCIGINASIRNRINLGNNSIIGMGSVVTKSVEDRTIVIGNPARVL